MSVGNAGSTISLGVSIGVKVKAADPKIGAVSTTVLAPRSIIGSRTRELTLSALAVAWTAASDGSHRFSQLVARIENAVCVQRRNMTGGCVRIGASFWSDGLSGSRQA